MLIFPQSSQQRIARRQAVYRQKANNGIAQDYARARVATDVERPVPLMGASQIEFLLFRWAHYHLFQISRNVRRFRQPQHWLVAAGYRCSHDK